MSSLPKNEPYVVVYPIPVAQLRDLVQSWSIVAAEPVGEGRIQEQVVEFVYTDRADANARAKVIAEQKNYPFLPTPTVGA